MTDPYNILGVSPSDSDEKIKEAYRELAKKYHPDNYSQSPLNDIADEKMADINSAFDEIMNSRRGGANTGGAYSYGKSDYSAGSDNMNYREIRRLIQKGDVTVADNMLEGIDSTLRGAEWYFLKGSVCYMRGWLDEAIQNFTRASELDPQNPEYRAALNQLASGRQGNMNGNPYQSYRTNQNVRGCSGCDMCSSLICADCCCECMGGDLISCC
ncbi:MAG: J domain-containing protein [Oscillospiraceae bacterium]|jgi:curved DNA-binding protein CbpA